MCLKKQKMNYTQRVIVIEIAIEFCIEFKDMNYVKKSHL
jgi:hypothetical protein